MRAMCCAILAIYFITHGRISVESPKGRENPAVIGLMLVASWVSAVAAIVLCIAGV